MSHKVRPGPRKRKARAQESQKARRGLWVFFGTARRVRLGSSAGLRVSQDMPNLEGFVAVFPDLRDYMDYHSRKQAEILERREAGE